MISIGIVGGGIGGLTLALACRQAGFKDIFVYEQADRVEGLGAGIQLSPNASRVLIALGLKKALDSIAFYPLAVHLRTWKSGYLVAQRPLGQFSEDRYGFPYYHLHRADLHQVLLDAALAARVTIATGKICSSLDTREGEERINFVDGAWAAHDVVIGCDGIHSAVRNALLGADEPRFTGHVAWRGMVPADRLPEGLIAPAVTAWMGPGKHFVHYYVRRGELVNFVGVVEVAGKSQWDNRGEESWRAEGDKAEIVEDFHDWHSSITTLIDAADHCFKWALYDRDPLPNWSAGRVTLLGDACHPMLPYMAQGAAMAIEDAWVLSRMLENWEEEINQGLLEYERYRRPRTNKVQLGSRAQGQQFHLGDRWNVLKRNFRLGFGSRFLPDVAMQQLDWLYGYDCVKGFD
ncbi:MAG: FAD-dependent monooxygenase [Gammaproteobacteria bacterium]|nr:FAD-dependent monooxygenase [Gammaproteobacteria bacterium]